MMIVQDEKLPDSIKSYVDKGKLYLNEAEKTSNVNSYNLAIQEFILAYKHALSFNSDRSIEVTCLFNLGASYIAGKYYSRGIDVLKSIPKIPEATTNAVLTKGDVLFNIGHAYDKMEQTDDAAKYYREALSEYRLASGTFSPMLCETLVKLGKCNLINGERMQAGDMFASAAKRYFENGLSAQGCRALLDQFSSQVPENGVPDQECLAILDECMQKVPNIEDQSFQSKLLKDIGLKFTLISDFDEALNCFIASQRLCSPDDRQHLAEVLQNIGAVYNRTQQYQKAMPFHRQSIALHGELFKRNAQGQCFCNLAYAQSRLEMYTKAKDNYNHALQAFKDTGDKNGEWQTYEGLAAVALLFKQTGKAVQHYQQAIKCLALSKSVNALALDRLVNKLTIALKHQLQLTQSEKKNSQKHLEGNRPSSSLQIELSRRSASPYRITEVDAPGSFPRPPITKKYSRNEDFIPQENAMVSFAKPPEERLPGIRPQMNRGRRTYGRGVERPMFSVARGLSTLTDWSLRSRQSIDDFDFDEFDGGRYNQFGQKIPFVESDIDSDDEGYDHIQSIPPAIEFAGHVYRPTFEKVTHDLQNVSRSTKKWKKNGKKRSLKPAQATVSENEQSNTLFEEPDVSEFPEQRRPTTAPRTTSRAGILRQKLSTDVMLEAGEAGGLSVSSDENDAANLTGTDYAGRYREQLKTVDDEEKKDDDSSSSSSSDDEDNKLPPSMPIRTAPYPPKKPPRKKRTHERSLQNPEESLYAQSSKKSLRFSPQVEDHTYEAIATEQVDGRHHQEGEEDSFSSSDSESSGKAEDAEPVFPSSFGEEDENENVSKGKHKKKSRDKSSRDEEKPKSSLCSIM